jgi:hypothetical protein
MSKQKNHHENQERTYESDMAGLMSLRLIAAPDPKDDLSDDELTAFCQDPKQSPELIRHLIDFIKTI